MNKLGFDYHPSTKHSVPDVLLDQVKVALWCAKEGFFHRNPGRTAVPVYSYSHATEEFLPNRMLDVRKKGEKQLKSLYLDEKLWKLFPGEFQTLSS